MSGGTCVSLPWWRSAVAGEPWPGRRCGDGRQVQTAAPPRSRDSARGPAPLRPAFLPLKRRRQRLSRAVPVGGGEACAETRPRPDAARPGRPFPTVFGKRHRLHVCKQCELQTDPDYIQRRFSVLQPTEE